ncbi:hypothetical protein P171DRAFT_479332 [Karstenula rhodostoma CBS 690.94]|uniref:Uncharacterized protein n=1 Tax=Karstenula rhodostoma CBS 690.94 TaxID=1392251 RepID=A0A9P4PVY0_9PLEO|nr:hypothetical protein P171DRAFT_479332 [Karstenula rhodostoma CBS 690.94]
MSPFKYLLPSFLQPTPAPTQPPLPTHSPRPSIPTLHRKSLALASALTAAESRLSTLHAQMHTALSSYETHYAFLRRIAHDAAGSNANAALQRNTAQLERVARGLEEAFEAVEVAVQVARVKARAQREGVEELVREDERLAGFVAERDNDDEELRARAARRWEGAERESGE